MKLAFFAAAMAASLSSSYALAFDTLPNSSVTPGLTTNLTAARICAIKWGSDARAVTAKMKADVYAAYNFDVRDCPPTTYKGKRVRRAEIDHLVPRSLGGADDERNLWPQCYEIAMKNKTKQANGAHKKDRLETELHKRLCQSPSHEALLRYQNGFKSNWLNLYHEIYPNE